MKPILLSLFLKLAPTSALQKTLLAQDQYGPSAASAEADANLIFNSIYAAMRQWGSSVQHNGMSLFPAYIPEGTLLYHGRGEAERVTGMEWLAFETHHAEMFAVHWERRKNDSDSETTPGTSVDHWDPRDELPQHLWAFAEPGRPPFDFSPGYLHIYQANRPLKLLYLDGMAAAKCDFGPMDTQDLLLLNFTEHKFADGLRASQLCELADGWGVEGFIRMECGFEVIKCDFSEGLDFLSHRRRPDRKLVSHDLFMLDFVREIANRYDGIGGGRVELDYSSMISAYFHPANLSNPDQDPNQSTLPRLVGSNQNVLDRIKSDLGGALKSSKGPGGIEWQGVADMIVKRYGARLLYMAANPPLESFIAQIHNLLHTFVDYAIPEEEQDPIKTCSMHYLLPVQPTSEQYRLLHVAFETVTRRICATLFEVRASLSKKEDSKDIEELQDTSHEAELIRKLNKWLDWADWKACGQCALDEVCFIAIFPFGTQDDHYHPHCINAMDLNDRNRIEKNYWMSNKRAPGE